MRSPSSTTKPSNPNHRAERFQRRSIFVLTGAPSPGQDVLRGNPREISPLFVLFFSRGGGRVEGFRNYIPHYSRHCTFPGEGHCEDGSPMEFFKVSQAWSGFYAFELDTCWWHLTFMSLLRYFDPSPSTMILKWCLGPTRAFCPPFVEDVSKPNP